MTTTIRQARPQDGAMIHHLICSCPPLDTNSVYAYFLLTNHHHKTCFVAEEQDEIIGAVTAYRLPEDPQILFIWQIAVAEKARGKGLASQLLSQLLQECDDIHTIHTTISPSNEASLASFRRLAQKLNAEFTTQTFLKENECGPGHEAEDLIIITPIKQS